MKSAHSNPTLFAELGADGEVAWLWSKPAFSHVARALTKREAASIDLADYLLVGTSLPNALNWQESLTERHQLN